MSRLSWESVQSLLWSRLAVQLPGKRGPLSPSLGAMSTTAVGADIAANIGGLPVWVAFVPTGGSGASPWRKFIMLDVSYRGRGQVSSPARVALVAHELSHVLQREISHPVFWPSGELWLAGPGRWLGDSTLCMEVGAYIVGGSVEWDLLEALGRDTRMASHLLATLTQTPPRNARRSIMHRYAGNRAYRNSYRSEAKLDHRRIPPGEWSDWLRAIGISEQAIEHVREQAAEGSPLTVTQEDVTHALKV